MTHTREDAQAMIARLDDAAREGRFGFTVGANLHGEAAAMIRAQLDELDKVRAERDALHKCCLHGMDMTNHHNAAMCPYCSADETKAREKLAEQVHTERTRAEARLAAVEAERDRMRDLIRWAHDTLWELNPSNYDHDEVCKVNDAAVEVILGLAPVIGETHGHSPEWWAARAALTATPANEGDTP